MTYYIKVIDAIKWTDIRSKNCTNVKNVKGIKNHSHVENSRYENGKAGNDWWRRHSNSWSSSLSYNLKAHKSYKW